MGLKMKVTVMILTGLVITGCDAADSETDEIMIVPPHAEQVAPPLLSVPQEVPEHVEQIAPPMQTETIHITPAQTPPDVIIEPIHTEIVLCDVTFVEPKNGTVNGHPALPWTDKLKTVVRNQFIVIEKILNSDEFIELYNKQAFSVLVQSESRNGFPTNYQGLASSIVDMQQCPYNLVLTDGNYGEANLGQSWIYMNADQYRNDTGLLLHEMSHTWGYEHTNVAHALFPTNLPYMLQIMVNKKADGLEKEYCGGGRCDPSLHLGLQDILEDSGFL